MNNASRASGMGPPGGHPVIAAEALLAASGDAIFAVAPDSTILSWSAGAARVFGLAAEAAIGRSYHELLHPADADIESARWLQIAVEVGSATYETVCQRSDGATLYMDASINAVREGTVLRYLVVTKKDVSELKYRRAARLVESRFGALLEAAPDAIVIVDRTGRIAAVNAQAEELFAWRRIEMLGKPVELLVPDRFREMHLDHGHGYFAAPRARPMKSGLELLARRRDGTEFPVEISLSPLDTEEGVLVTAAIRDVSDRKEQYRRVQEANRLKSEFPANMSHELRTPLNGIIGFAELMHDGKVGPIGETQKEYLGDILTSAQHLLQLINDVLDLSKVESGKVDFHPQALQLATLIGEVRDILRTLAAQKRITVETTTAPEVAQIVTDPAKLKQVLYNYLSNAIKFTPEGGHVAVRARAEGMDQVRLEVEDSGIGIRAEDMSRLFVEFQQLDTSAAKKYPGTGLGLALTKRIVESQGGRVEVKSTPGVGSVFAVVLPSPALATVSAVAVEDPATPSPARSNAPRILVVEDNPDDRRWLISTLTRAGYAVESVSSGLAAVERARQVRFDGVTVDLILPDMSGREVLRAIRAGGPNVDTPVIVVSVVSERGVSAGFRVSDFLVKPVEMGTLVEAVRHAVGPAVTDHRVLVVDDNQADGKLAEQSLRTGGFGVLTFADAKSALAQAEREEPAAVVLDLLMPEMDGFEFLHRFRSRKPNRLTPVIVWSGKEITAADRARLREGVQAVVTKNASGSGLLAEIRAHVPLPPGARE